MALVRTSWRREAPMAWTEVLASHRGLGMGTLPLRLPRALAPDLASHAHCRGQRPLKEGVQGWSQAPLCPLSRWALAVMPSGPCWHAASPQLQ